MPKWRRDREVEVVLSRSIRRIQEEDLFAAALALPSTERDGYLKRACRDNADLLKRLTALLDSFGNAATFVADGEPTSQCMSDQVGPYHLLRELGEGGCGIAYLAEQTAPVKREVAVKIIKPGMDTKAVIARFEAERQVLALLDHPNIAKVFDADATPEGRPYFVMELVRGIRITEYCAQSHLTIPERLSLFIQVCQAIQHAHQKGVIHRDIKPSNILITMHDGLPLAKVIDFGIAKATQGRLIDQTLHTEVDQIMGTPAYISPEQAEPTQAAVDTRSDIYCLGVLLYELLTGHTPFDASELAQASLERLRHRLRTEEPLRPSRRLKSLPGDMLAQISCSCDTTVVKLIKQVTVDLDWIVMQCLEKVPGRRYQAVNELIADIGRYLRHEPILARPPSLAYTVWKLARRNRVAFASTVAFLVLVAAFAVTMTIHAQRIAAERDLARLERQRAQQVSNVALNIFAIADPFQSFGNDVSGPALLDQAAKSIERELRDQPVPRARLLQAIGSAYVRRGEFEPAMPYLNETAQVLRNVQGAERETLLAMVDLSSAVRISGDPHAAGRTLVDAEDFAKRSGLEQSAGYAKLLLNKGRVELEQGRVAEARSVLNRSLGLFRETVGSQSVEVAEVLGDLAAAYLWTDDLVQSERLARDAISIFEATVPPMHPDRVRTELVLAEALYLQSQLDQAASMLLTTLRNNTVLFGRNSLQVADVLDRLAVVRYEQRRFDEAESFSREAVANERMIFGDTHAFTANIATTLARTLIELRKFTEAEATLRQSLNVFAVKLPPDHQYVASAEYFLGEVLLATNRPSEAEAVLTASMDRWRRSGAPPWRAMRSASALGEALYRQGRTAEGEKYLSDSLRELSADPKAELAAKNKARERAKRYLRGPQSPPQSKRGSI